MKGIIIFLISILAVSFQMQAQDNYGFYGKKNYVNVTTNSYVPIIYNLIADRGAKVSSTGNSLERSNDWFNIGVRASVGRTFASNMGLALDVGYERITLNNDQLLWQMDGDKKRNESFKVNSILIMPKLEFSAKNGLLPNGLVHQVGIGFSMNSIVEKNYLVEHGTYTTGGPNGSTADQTQLFQDYNIDGSVTLIQIMYGVKMRTPVSKWLMIDYGFKYSLDFPILSSGIDPAAQIEIFGFQLMNLISFDIGVTMPF